MSEHADSPPKDVSIEDLQKCMNEQLEVLSNHYNSLQEQLEEVRSCLDKTNEDVARRVERLTTLMTNHMVCFRQLVELVNNYGDQLTENEKADAKRDLTHASLIERQNRFAAGLVKLNKNTSDIVNELEQLKQRCDEQEKFQWKLTVIVSIASSVIGWLVAGTSFTDLIKSIKNWWLNS